MFNYFVPILKKSTHEAMTLAPVKFQIQLLDPPVLESRIQKLQKTIPIQTLADLHQKHKTTVRKFEKTVNGKETVRNIQ